MNWIKISAIIAVLVFCLCGCKDIPNVTKPPKEEFLTDFPIEIHEVVFDKAPASTISLSPALTEIICELGFESNLIGRSSYCDYPESIKLLPEFGSSANPNLDEIISHKPELLISSSPLAGKHVKRLESAGVKVLILPTPSTYNGVREVYIQISGIFGGGVNAEESAKKALSALDELLMSATPSKSFAYIMTYDLAVATGDTLSGDFLAHFGQNIAQSGQKYVLSQEELLEEQPELILIAAPMNIGNFSAEVQNLNAIKENNVIIVNNACFERPTTRLLMELATAILAH